MKKPGSIEMNHGIRNRPTDREVNALLAKDTNVQKAWNDLENSFQELETMLAKINLFFQTGEMGGNNMTGNR